MTETDAWNVGARDFPADRDLEEQTRGLIPWAILAPSSHNTQPWLFRVQDNVIDLRADRTRGLPVVDPLDRELMMSCGAALLSTREDDERNWVVAGQALGRLLLAATSHGVSASFLNQPVEVQELRGKLREASGADGFPQLLLRMGIPQEAPPPTPRRPLGEVLSSSPRTTSA
jgi:nitroreductase